MVLVLDEVGDDGGERLEMWLPMWLNGQTQFHGSVASIAIGNIAERDRVPSEAILNFFFVGRR